MCRCLDAQVSCCCGPSPSALCCSCLPNIKESMSTRIMYTVLLLMVTVIACLMQVSQVQDFLAESLPGGQE
ncbi:hypothetical protein LSAT2_013773 [Lamellibrachia satsuma]|nr:hypothetical protein LSAT2_013773 [Lamellibrachia satsuma]